ncbi:Hypothetical predicted protein [Paramuricea clavata]|uniref:Uncharacterized protein n=1 Tax=Paramuricea clavata TaxID=317549 RepID=A0A7D9LHE4_PARCT|nr:Hypothetical predicted protein [Paramuricea clavata]
MNHLGGEIDDVDECSRLAVQDESSFDMMPSSTKSNLEGFKAFKRQEDERKTMYLEQHLGEFCISCGINEKAVNSYLDEGKKHTDVVYVVSTNDCKICIDYGCIL